MFNTISYSILYFNTVEPRFNEPLYNEVLGITNNNYSSARPNLQ